MICEVGNHSFELSQDDIAAYSKFGFEPLPICFLHQHQWRLAFRKDRFLHKRKCDLTGAEIVSMYPSDAPYKVYEQEAWHSDKWDAFSYGRDFDFSRTFFEQYAELQRDVPRMSLANFGSTNSEYCNCTVYNKNCFLIFGGDYNEDCMYGSLPMFCKNSLDCDWTSRCELCYFSAYSEQCYQCRFTFNSKNCSDCAFIEDCISCHDCILCFDLKHKSYCIENIEYSKEDYLKKKAELLDGTYSNQQKLWNRFLELRKNRMVKYAHILNAENSSGDYIFNSKNCRNCYECIGSEDCRECRTIFSSKDCFNSDYVGHNSALFYNSIAAATAYNTQFSYWTISSNDIEYSELSISSKNLFGCIGMRHQQYCIFNKKYSKEDFAVLREKIIAHMKKTNEWGRFFPKSLSTFSYNESTASFFFPRKKEEAISEGFRWRDETIPQTKQTFQIPDDITNVTDDILSQPFACETTGKNFLITPQELAFYRLQKIPIPRKHPDARYLDRLQLRNPQELFEQSCQKCKKPVQTTYRPDRPEKVYCEKCYLETVY